jgi:O-antigen ligase
LTRLPVWLGLGLLSYLLFLPFAGAISRLALASDSAAQNLTLGAGIIAALVVGLILTSVGRLHTPGPFVLLFGGLCLLAVLNESWHQDTRMFLLYLIYALVSQAGKSSVNYIRPNDASMLMQIACALYTVFAIRESVNPTFVADNIYFERTATAFAHPNAMAAFGCALIASLTAISVRSGKGSLLVIASAAATLVGVATTRSMTGIGVAIILLGALLWLHLRRDDLTNISRVVIGAVCVISMLGVFISLYSARSQEFREITLALSSSDVNTLQYGSLYWRVEVWKRSLSFLNEAPVTGFGLGSFSDTTNIGNLAHNEFIRVSLEAGWAGILVTIAALALLVRQAWRRSAVPIASVALIVGFVLLCFFLNMFNYASATMLFVYAFEIMFGGYALRLSRAQSPRAVIEARKT